MTKRNNKFNHTCTYEQQDEFVDDESFARKLLRPTRTWLHSPCIVAHPMACNSNSPFCTYGRHFDLDCFERHYGMLRGHINMYEYPIIAI